SIGNEDQNTNPTDRNVSGRDGDTGNDDKSNQQRDRASDSVLSRSRTSDPSGNPTPTRDSTAPENELTTTNVRGNEPSATSSLESTISDAPKPTNSLAVVSPSGSTTASSPPAAPTACN
ncbi:hypothetical protein K7432_017910, partial [Basidiobolus ranarum]